MINQENDLINEEKLNNIHHEKKQLMNTINSVTDEVNINSNIIFY
jgi:hypothetical protein